MGLLTFPKEILNEKLHFLCSDIIPNYCSSIPVHRKCSVEKDVLKNFANFAINLQNRNKIYKSFKTKIFKFTKHLRATASVYQSALFCIWLSAIMDQISETNSSFHVK